MPMVTEAAIAMLAYCPWLRCTAWYLVVSHQTRWLEAVLKDSQAKLANYTADSSLHAGKLLPLKKMLIWL